MKELNKFIDCFLFVLLAQNSKGTQFIYHKRKEKIKIGTKFRGKEKKTRLI